MSSMPPNVLLGDKNLPIVDVAESISYIQLRQTIQEMGLVECPVCLHASLKSFGYVEGGDETVIRAFLDLGCTLLVPVFTYDCAVPPPPGRQVLQNGWDDSWHFDPENVAVYDRDSAMISREMGAIPARLLQMEGRVRGDHPLDSFCALGPLAAELIAAQTPLDVYAPFEALYTHPAARLALIAPTNTPTRTNTPVPPASTFTPTNTVAAPTNTLTRTNTPVPSTNTPTPMVPTNTPTATPTSGGGSGTCSRVNATITTPFTKPKMEQGHCVGNPATWAVTSTPGICRA